MGSFSPFHWLVLAGIVWVSWRLLRRAPASTTDAVTKSKLSWVTYAFVAVFGIAVFRACTPNEPAASVAAAAAERQAAATAQKNAIEADRCKRGLADMQAKYAAQFKAGEYSAAVVTLGECPDLLGDPALKTMGSEALRQGLLKTADDPKGKPDERVTAISELLATFPADGAKYARLNSNLKAQVEKASEAERRRVAAADKARRKKSGVSIGMSKEDVLLSSWGKPQKINTSTYSFGVHEQWVYGGSYLYFEDGVLKAIQN